MKQVLKKFTAAAITAMLSSTYFCTFSSFAESGSSEEKNQVTVHFDLSEEGISIEEDEDGNPQEITDITADPNSSVRLPEPELVKDGYVFSGWTENGVRGYTAGSVIQVEDEDITLTPVWYSTDDEDYHDITYYVEIDGEVVDMSDTLIGFPKRKGQFIDVPLVALTYPNNTYIQHGWVYDGVTYLGQQKIVMPDHDVVLTPNWLKYYKLTFSAGDVDRLTGASYNEFERVETLPTDTPESSRFSRQGFTISGWQSDYDGQIYKPLSKFVMPSQDTTLTAVWEPIDYVVVFKAETGKSSDNIKISGKTDTTIICPELTVTKDGYYFAGWQYEDKIYKPGDEFLIKGAPKGMGIAPTAIWLEGTAPPTDEPSGTPGDANLDKNVDLADAVLIMQSIANPDVYGINGSDPTHITSQGITNGDCCNPGDGITSQDALAVQMLRIKLVDSLPINDNDVTIN